MSIIESSNIEPFFRHNKNSGETAGFNLQDIVHDKNQNNNINEHSISKYNHLSIPVGIACCDSNKKLCLEINKHLKELNPSNHVIDDSIFNSFLDKISYNGLYRISSNKTRKKNPTSKKNTTRKHKK